MHLWARIMIDKYLHGLLIGGAGLAVIHFIPPVWPLGALYVIGVFVILIGLLLKVAGGPEDIVDLIAGCMGYFSGMLGGLALVEFVHEVQFVALWSVTSIISFAFFSLVLRFLRELYDERKIDPVTPKPPLTATPCS